MPEQVTFEQVEKLAALLPPIEQERLARKILFDLASPTPAEKGEQEGYDWMSIRGIAPGLLRGEDAQEWVSRTRCEADEHREKQWRRTS